MGGRRGKLSFRGVLGVAMMLAWLLASGSRGQTAEAATPLPVNLQAAVPHLAMTAPVIVRGETIFQVRGILSFSAAARAAAISQRITDLSQEVTFDPKSLAVSDAEGTSDIVAGDLVLMSVTDEDAQGTGLSRQALAAEYAHNPDGAAEGLLGEEPDAGWGVCTGGYARPVADLAATGVCVSQAVRAGGSLARNGDPVGKDPAV
jgi:hypothetical protein